MSPPAGRNALVASHPEEVLKEPGPTRAGGPAYYAVKLALDGEEDLSTFDRGNSLREPVEESVGPGAPVLQRIEHPEEFNYVKGPTLLY